jgi:hypothetical protein
MAGSAPRRRVEITQLDGVTRTHTNIYTPVKIAIYIYIYIIYIYMQVKIAQLDGITPIMAAMERHGGHQLCLQYCCWALKNLALNEANKNRVAGGRGPRLIVEALRGYRACVRACVRVCVCVCVCVCRGSSWRRCGGTPNMPSPTHPHTTSTLDIVEALPRPRRNDTPRNDT